jgi:hypothetical protein
MKGDASVTSIHPIPRKKSTASQVVQLISEGHNMSSYTSGFVPVAGVSGPSDPSSSRKRPQPPRRDDKSSAKKPRYEQSGSRGPSPTQKQKGEDEEEDKEPGAHDRSETGDDDEVDEDDSPVYIQIQGRTLENLRFPDDAQLHTLGGDPCVKLAHLPPAIREVLLVKLARKEGERAAERLR